VPELPEVETVRRDLEPLTHNDVVTQVEILLERSIAYPDPSTFTKILVGGRFQTWSRRGKYLIASFAQGFHLGIHLRMTGQLLYLTTPSPLTTHTRVRFLLEGDKELRFQDQRTFGQLWAIPADQEITSVIPAFQRLGPEPFSPQFSPAQLAQAFCKSQRPIKSALLDQQLVAGLGNIYADEALFLSLIHPLTPSNRLPMEKIQTLHAQILQVLTDGLQQRGTTLRNYRDASGINGNYQGQAWVYGRRHLPCRRCGTLIERLKIAGRSAHVCPTCQPEVPLS
jgi:formamidopyrimidine-DNA glycosylase